MASTTASTAPVPGPAPRSVDDAALGQAIDGVAAMAIVRRRDDVDNASVAPLAHGAPPPVRQESRTHVAGHDFVKSASGRSRKGASTYGPTLLTSTSMAPSCAVTAATSRSLAPASEQISLEGAPSHPLLSVRRRTLGCTGCPAIVHGSAPPDASRRAIATPKPRGASDRCMSCPASCGTADACGLLASILPYSIARQGPRPRRPPTRPSPRNQARHKGPKRNGVGRLVGECKVPEAVRPLRASPSPR